MIILIGFPYIHDDCLLALEKMMTLDLLYISTVKFSILTNGSLVGFWGIIDDFDRVIHNPVFCLYW